MMAKTEMNTSNYKERVMRSEITYSDTGSECKGRRWWPRLKWTPVVTRESCRGLREHAGTPDQSANGDNSGKD